jgi:kynurenine formamidase
MHIVDLSMPIAPHFRWPVELSIKGDIAAGDQFRVSKVNGPCHGFSHVDARRAFRRRGADDRGDAAEAGGRPLPRARSERAAGQ